MKKLIPVVSVLAMTSMITIAIGCSSERRVTTTTRETTVEAVPVDPVVTEKRTTIYTQE